MATRSGGSLARQKCTTVSAWAYGESIPSIAELTCRRLAQSLTSRISSRTRGCRSRCGGGSADDVDPEDAVGDVEVAVEGDDPGRALKVVVELPDALPERRDNRHRVSLRYEQVAARPLTYISRGLKL